MSLCQDPFHTKGTSQSLPLACSMVTNLSLSYS